MTEPKSGKLAWPSSRLSLKRRHPPPPPTICKYTDSDFVFLGGASSLLAIPNYLIDRRRKRVHHLSFYRLHCQGGLQDWCWRRFKAPGTESGEREWELRWSALGMDGRYTKAMLGYDDDKLYTRIASTAGSRSRDTGLCVRLFFFFPSYPALTYSSLLSSHVASPVLSLSSSRHPSSFVPWAQRQADTFNDSAAVSTVGTRSCSRSRMLSCLGASFLCSEAQVRRDTKYKGKSTWLGDSE